MSYPQQQWQPARQHPAYRPPRQHRPRSTRTILAAIAGTAAGVVVLAGIIGALATPQPAANQARPAAAVSPKATAHAAPGPPRWPGISSQLAARGFTDGAGWDDQGPGWQEQYGNIPAGLTSAYRWNTAAGHAAATADIGSSGTLASGGTSTRGWAIAAVPAASGSSTGGHGHVHCWVNLRHPLKRSSCDAS